MSDQLCAHCQKTHEPGSADWRDCRQTQFEAWVADPSKWVFTVTPEQRQRVIQAHENARHDLNVTPDVQTIRSLIGNQFVTDKGDSSEMDAKGMLKFWQSFIDDMPELLRVQGNLYHSVDALWSQHKLYHIMDVEKRVYMHHETADVMAHLNSPDSLRHAASEMERLEAQGYALYHRETMDHEVNWYFRKGQLRNAVPTEQDKAAFATVVAAAAQDPDFKIVTNEEPIKP